MMTVGVVIIAVVTVGDLIFYGLAVYKYGPRGNFWPLSGYYEWFIRRPLVQQHNDNGKEE